MLANNATRVASDLISDMLAGFRGRSLVDYVASIGAQWCQCLIVRNCALEWVLGCALAFVCIWKWVQRLGRNGNAHNNIMARERLQVQSSAKMYTTLLSLCLSTVCVRLAYIH